jgi:hypothetical protein
LGLIAHVDPLVVASAIDYFIVSIPVHPRYEASIVVRHHHKGLGLDPDSVVSGFRVKN